MDFEIQSVSDLFSILFKMEGQADLEIATSKDLAVLSEDALFLHFKNGYINHILSNYHASVESIQDMDAHPVPSSSAHIFLSVHRSKTFQYSLI